MGAVTDAAGFVCGALAGFALGRWLGLDLFAPGYGTEVMAAIVMVGLGGGAGAQLARHAASRRRRPPGS